MKIKTIGLGLAFSLAVGALCFGSPDIGTWKLNEAKSIFGPGEAKNFTIVIAEAPGGMLKITADGIDKNGKPTHSEWTGKFDGNDYPVTGDPTSDMRLYKQVDPNTMDFVAKKDGNNVFGGRINLSADGKTRTVITSGTDPDGKRFKNMGFYDRAEETKK